jgi:DNA repair ATPase RecN
MRARRSAISPRFERLRLRNVRCFDAADVPLDPHVTVIIGENGAGKTTIAEAMASLSAGEREGLPAFPLRRGASDGAIALYETGSAEPVALWTAGERQRLPESRYLFAYGRYRRVQPSDRSGSALGGPELLGPEWEDAALYASLESNLSAIVNGRRTTTLFASDHYLLRDLGRYLLDLNRLRSSSASVEVAWQALDASVRALGLRSRASASSSARAVTSR